MKHRIILLLFLLAISFLYAGCREEPVKQGKKPLIGAYYYPWYSADKWKTGYVGGYLKPKITPLLGEYDSRDMGVIRQHIEQCAEYGIDFVVASWWGKDRYEDVTLRDFFGKAPNIAKIKFAIMYESSGLLGLSEGKIIFDDEKIEKLTGDFEYIANTYFNHPSYLKINGRPVAFIYISRTFDGAYKKAIKTLRKRMALIGYKIYLVGDEIFWDDPKKERIALFDAITSYNMYEWPFRHHAGYASRTSFLDDVSDKYNEYKYVAGERVMFIPNVIAGYNDRGVRLNADHYVIPRQIYPGAPEGSFFVATIKRFALEMLDRDTWMIMITSFNEWHEGSQIEPSIEGIETDSDISPSGRDYTEGFLFRGYGKRYLEIVREELKNYRSMQNETTRSLCLTRDY